MQNMTIDFLFKKIRCMRNTVIKYAVRHFLNDESGKINIQFKRN